MGTSRRSFGSIETVKPGEVYRLHWCVDGVRLSRRVRGSKRDAERELAAIQVNQGKGDSLVTYDEYWQAVVLPNIERLAPKTKAEYSRIWNRELQPLIGHLRVRDTTFRKAQSVLFKISAPSSQDKARKLWHKICRMAIEQDGLLAANPISRDLILAEVPHKNKELVSAPEVPAFMEFIKGSKHELVLLCELGGGLSPEEACALLMTDIVCEDGYAFVSIYKTLVTVGGQKVLQEKTKTKFRTREVVIGAPFAGRIAELVTGEVAPICPSNVFVPGSEISERSFASPSTITHNWRRRCRAHGFRYVSQANMRSSWATMQGEAGSPGSLVSLAMGHSDGTTRGRFYQQNTRRGMCLIADMLAEFLASVTPD